MAGRRLVMGLAAAGTAGLLLVPAGGGATPGAGGQAPPQAVPAGGPPSAPTAHQNHKPKPCDDDNDRNDRGKKCASE